MTWHVTSAGHFYECDEDMVVYFDPASGDTHLISEFAAFLIQKIALHPMATPELIELVSTGVDSQDSAQLIAGLPDALEQLAGLDILCDKPCA